MKIVFLDFDGVLNSMDVIASARETHTPDDEFWRDDHIDPTALARVDAVLSRTGAYVVISSTWRKLYELDELRAILTRRGMVHVDRVIDVTPSLWRDAKGNRLYRGHEIQAWLDEHPEVTTFVILDDDADMAHLMSLLVQTSMETGLLDEHVNAAIALLGESQ